MTPNSKKQIVSIVRYEKPLDSVRKAVDLSRGLDHLPSNAGVFITVRKAVDLSRGLDHLPSNAGVFIKPNIVFWSRFGPFPAYGVITTSRVVEDMVILLK
ncbi:MAG: hypothetical protein B6240_00535, partial [Desulfobacteraceae bacterium 4572_87]